MSSPPYRSPTERRESSQSLASSFPHREQNRAPGSYGAPHRAHAPVASAPSRSRASSTAQLGVDPLQLGRFAGEDVEPDVVADRHLVEGAAEVGLHHRELLQQPVALGDQLRGWPAPAWAAAEALPERPSLGVWIFGLILDIMQRWAAWGLSASQSPFPWPAGLLGPPPLPPTTITSGRSFWEST